MTTRTIIIQRVIQKSIDTKYSNTVYNNKTKYTHTNTYKTRTGGKKNVYKGIAMTEEM
jgi:hypothetical protein